MKTTSVAGRTWHYSHCLGRETGEHNGTTGGYLHPVDVAAAPDGILFVLSRGFGHINEARGGDVGKRIGKTTIDEDHIGDFARNGFTWPVGIAVSRDGTVFCSDEHENAVTSYDPDGIMNFPEFDPEGESLTRWGEPGSGPGQLRGPTGITFDSDDNLLVVNSGNGRVQRFTKDGEYLAGWGCAGDGEGEFDSAWGVAVDGAGDVYVADWGNDRVQKFSPDGAYLMSFGSDGGELDHPVSVAVDGDGDVYVTDWGNRRVQIYGPDGDILTALYGDVHELSKAGHYIRNRDPESILTLNAVENAMLPAATFQRPTGITITKDGRIVIADTCGRLLVYDKDNDYVVPNV